MKITAIVLVYLLSAFICYGIDFAYFQGKFPSTAEHEYFEDMGKGIAFGLAFGILGPFGVLFMFLYSGLGKYGFKIK